ncbi:hypothetical protein J4Q44_G00161430, partial [Coregonus suidteri]
GPVFQLSGVRSSAKLTPGTCLLALLAHPGFVTPDLPVFWILFCLRRSRPASAITTPDYSSIPVTLTSLLPCYYVFWISLELYCCLVSFRPVVSVSPPPQDFWTTHHRLHRTHRCHWGGHRPSALDGIPVTPGAFIH